MNPKYRILHQHEMKISSEKQTCRATNIHVYSIPVKYFKRGGGGGGCGVMQTI